MSLYTTSATLFTQNSNFWEFVLIETQLPYFTSGCTPQMIYTPAFICMCNLTLMHSVSNGSNSQQVVNIPLQTPNTYKFKVNQENE